MLIFSCAQWLAKHVSVRPPAWAMYAEPLARHAMAHATFTPSAKMLGRPLPAHARCQAPTLTTQASIVYQTADCTLAKTIVVHHSPCQECVCTSSSRIKLYGFINVSNS